jgi:predicted Zn finger-like uncharacterized protein
MSGTTLCPHCNTRFRIAAEQLEAHQGMVRCGSCLQAFDARPGYIPDQPNPQLELQILDEAVEPSATPPAAEVIEESIPAEESLSGEGAEPAEENISAEEITLSGETAPAEKADPLEATPPSADETAAQGEAPEVPRDDSLPDSQPPAAEPEDEAPPAAANPVALTLAEQVAIVQDEDEEEKPAPPAYRRWPWMIAAFLLLLALLAQAAYFFRVELAARLPNLKPVLTDYCQLLGCDVPLPRKAGLMSIESSDLEADPDRENHITLNALLRNRAPYAQAFPNLELTLSDTNDQPLARRVFKPKDYLPPQENEPSGLRPNHELVVKLYLDTADLKPTGYRLVLYYPQQ